METTDIYVARAGLLGLLAVEAILGYEWLMSGLTKLVRGGFPGGLPRLRGSYFVHPGLSSGH